MRVAARFSIPRPWWWDAGLGAAFFLVGVVTVAIRPVTFASDITGGPVPARLAVIGALCLLETVRTRHPAPAVVVAVPLAAADIALGFSVPGVLVLADLLYCAVLHGSPRTSRWTQTGAFGLWVAGLAAIALVTGSVDAVARTALTSSALLLLPVFWAREVRRPTDEAAAERAAAAQAAHIAELDRRAAVTDERARIARDLHDSIAGHLSAIALQSQAALRADGSTPQDAATRETVLRAVRENSVRSLEEMRMLIEVLRRAGPDGATSVPDGPPAASLRDGLPVLLASARAAGLEVRDDVAVLGDVPAPVDLTAYRILQEALTNAATHAPGATVGLRVAREAGELVVEVENTPTAAARGTSGGKGTGVEGMRIRARAVGGCLDAGPDGDRWRVHGRLPLGEGS